MNRKPVEPSNRRIRQLFAIWNDPQRMKKKKTKTCANCTLNCDASIKFACSKFPKPCYESVNFEICCRSIIMDGFRYNCVGSVYSRFSVQSLHAKVPVLPSRGKRCRGRLLQSKRLTSCNASNSMSGSSSVSSSGCRWRPSPSAPYRYLYRYMHLYLLPSCCCCCRGCGSCRRDASLEVAQIHLSKKREQKETPKRHAGAPRVF